MKHCKEYDFIRAVAILLVVWGHSAYIVMYDTGGGVNWQLPENLSPAYDGTVLSTVQLI